MSTLFSLIGVMKKLLLAWFVEPKGKARLLPQQKNVVNILIESVRQTTSIEIARKPRSVDEVKRWKATEFRTFLIYTGKVVMRDILDKKRYLHFLNFSVGLNIYSTQLNSRVCTLMKLIVA